MYTPTYARRLAAAAVIASALFAAPVLAAAAADDTVIAVVNGSNIYKKDILAAIKTLPLQAGADTKEIFPLVVDEVINEKLIDDAAAASKVENSDDYKKRLELAKAQVAKQIYLEQQLKEKISDKAIKAEYNKFREANKGKEEVRASHILVKTEEEAKQVIRDLDEGAKFEDLAKQRSSDTMSATNGGDLGWFMKEQMLPEFSDAAFKLKPGEVTKKPVQTKFGWHVIKSVDRHALEVPALKDVEQPIRKKLVQDAMDVLVTKLRDKAEIKLFDMDGKPLAFGDKKGGSEKEDKPVKETKSDDKKDDGDSKKE